MAIEATIKRWGNSFGIVIPKEIIERERLKENKKVIINIIKVADLSDIFGLVKNSKLSGQKMKYLSRKEWEK